MAKRPTFKPDQAIRSAFLSVYVAIANARIAKAAKSFPVA